MKKRIVVIAPHPDDETLGCGGTLFRHSKAGDSLFWVIGTNSKGFKGFSDAQQTQREIQIKKVANCYKYEKVFQLGYPTTQLDKVPLSDLVEKFGKIFGEVKPHIVYLPFRGDVHSDHRQVYDACVSSLKWFRCPSPQRILAYETLSETEQQLSSNASFGGFAPNVFVDISSTYARKVAVLRFYKSEIGAFPFPRSIRALRALAEFRGTTAGFKLAEAFVLLRERL